MGLHIHDLVISRGAGVLTRQDLKTQKLVRIRRGVYLPTSVIPKDSPPWRIRRIVTQARVLSLALIRAEEPPPIFTLESALALYDLPTWINTPDISYRLEEGRSHRSPIVLPAVRIRNTQISEVRERLLRSDRTSTETIDGGGFLVSPLEEIAIDCARTLHPMAATVAASSVLHRLTRFDARYQTEPRAKELKLRDDLIQMIEAAPRLATRRQTRKIIEIADAGMQTPGEGYLLWICHCIIDGAVNGYTQSVIRQERRIGGSLPAQDIAIFAQYEVIACGHRYFPDVAIPSHMVIVEFDGGEKITEPRARYAFLERQRNLQRAGWHVIRVDPKQINRPRALINYLTAELSQYGIPVRHPRKPLWKPIPPDLLDRQRRY